MTLLNTAANLGGTWPSSMIMWLVGHLTQDPHCVVDPESDQEVCTGGWDPYLMLQVTLSCLGCIWILFLGRRVRRLAELPDDAWRTHLLDKEIEDGDLLNSTDVELGETGGAHRRSAKEEKRE